MLEELEELFGSKPSIQRLRKARTKTAWTNLIRQYRLSLHECTQSFSVQFPLSLRYCVVLTAVHYAQPGFNSLERISLGDCFIGISHLFPPQFRFPPWFWPPSASDKGSRWLWADTSFVFCPCIQTWTKCSHPDYTSGIIFKRSINLVDQMKEKYPNMLWKTHLLTPALPRNKEGTDWWSGITECWALKSCPAVCKLQHLKGELGPIIMRCS